MHKRIAKLYQDVRKAGWTAQSALRDARTRYAFWRREAPDYLKSGDSHNCVRLRVEWDHLANAEDLMGECYCPRANPDIPASRLERQKKEFLQRRADCGAVGIVGEYWDEREQAWVQTDSVWGFVGDDWKHSGYDTDIMQSALDARTKSVRAWRAMCKAAP